MYVLITMSNHTNEVATCLCVLHCSKTGELMPAQILPVMHKKTSRVQIIQMARVQTELHSMYS